MSAMTVPEAAGTVDVVLRDGRTVHVRPMGPGDGELIAELLGRLSPEGRRMRFLGAADPVRPARRIMDAAHGAGLLSLAGTPPRAVAHAAFVPYAPGHAEIAFEVDADWQGNGLATLLLGHLAQRSAAAGVEVFTAFVHPDNR